MPIFYRDNLSPLNEKFSSPLCCFLSIFILSLSYLLYSEYVIILVDRLGNEKFIIFFDCWDSEWYKLGMSQIGKCFTERKSSLSLYIYVYKWMTQSFTFYDESSCESFFLAVSENNNYQVRIFVTQNTLATCKNIQLGSRHFCSPIKFQQILHVIEKLRIPYEVQIERCGTTVFIFHRVLTSRELLSRFNWWEKQK